MERQARSQKIEARKGLEKMGVTLPTVDEAEEDVQELLEVKKGDHQCKLCLKTFKTTQHLRDHINTHKKLRPHACAVANCGKAFASKRNLRQHMQEHREEPTHACNKCPQKFVLPGHLTQHIKQCHPKKVKPIKCKFCQNLFHVRRYFEKHVSVCEQNPKREEREVFKCSLAGCNRSFLRKDSLSLHIQVDHMGKLPVKCKFCKQSFKNRAARVIHVREKHPEVEIDKPKGRK